MKKKQLEVLVAELRQELLERVQAHDEFMNMFPGLACNIADSPGSCHRCGRAAQNVVAIVVWTRAEEKHVKQD